MAKTKKIVASHDEELDVEFQEETHIYLNTHESINQDLCGEIQKLDLGVVEIELTTTQDMVADDMGLIHGGFVFSAADYAAMAAVNEKNVVLVASECEFLSPVKLGDVVKIIAADQQPRRRQDFRRALRRHLGQRQVEGAPTKIKNQGSASGRHITP